MKFTIHRVWDDGDVDRPGHTVCPCEGAVEVEIPHWDERVWTEAEHDEKCREPWRSNGTNHQVLPNGRILRQIGTEWAWTLEVQSLEELLSLQRTLAEPLIIKAASYPEQGSLPDIEIYDEYRE